MCDFLKAVQSWCSSLVASAGYSTFLKRKYFTFINRFILRCESSLDFTESVLLPMYTITCLASPSSYTPGFSGARPTCSLKAYHLLIGILHHPTITAVLPLYQFVNRYIKQDATHTMFNVWQTSRASFCPLVLASSEGLSR